MKFAAKLTSLNIQGRLVAGFSAVLLFLVAATSVTVWKVIGIESDNQRIVDLRVPTAFASSGMVNNINASLAALRGWMLTGNTAFTAERAAVWADIHNITTEMDRLSANWTNPDNVERWTAFKSVLNEFAVAQQKVEDIAHTPDEQPATKILVTDAAPRAATIVKSITGMIDAEQNLAATPARKAFLGMMADVRGTMGMSLANIRAFLLTGDDKFREKFDVMWSKNERRFKDLEGQVELMSKDQKKLFGELSAARKAFAPLPPPDV